MVISGNIVDVVRRCIFKGRLYVDDGKIVDIQEADDVNDVFIVPGLVDSHVHVESSMVTPARFAQNAVRFGVVAAVADPHEIANVCGMDGVRFMVDNAAEIPFKFYFGAPSCVPATPFEANGATLDHEHVALMIETLGLRFVGEMMNFPGVVGGDPTVMRKLAVAKRCGVPVDGHAPMLSGKKLQAYVAAGIETDHECASLKEAEEKIAKGMKILIREGSAARNLDALMPLINKHTDQVMICTDDFHPDNFAKGYLNEIVKYTQSKGVKFWNIMQALTINPVAHYRLDVGLLQVGDSADFVVVSDTNSFTVLQTWVKGQLAYSANKAFEKGKQVEAINNFNAKPIDFKDVVLADRNQKIKVIKVFDGQLFTEQFVETPKTNQGMCVSDTKRDILKMVVVNRYDSTAKPSVAFVRGFGLKRGAMASSVAHDSHNVIAVGTDDIELVRAINLVINAKGGLAVVDGDKAELMELPVGGLMTDLSVTDAGKIYSKLEGMAKNLGSNLKAPFMTLAFMSLLVIPKLKLGDRGLFDVQKFEFTDLFVEEKINVDENEEPAALKPAPDLQNGLQTDADIQDREPDEQPDITQMPDDLIQLG